MGQHLIDQYEEFERTQQRVEANRQHAREAVRAHRTRLQALSAVADIKRGPRRLERPQAGIPDYRGDASGNPSESIDLTHYGRVMAERERMRRQAVLD